MNASTERIQTERHDWPAFTHTVLQRQSSGWSRPRSVRPASRPACSCLSRCYLYRTPCSRVPGRLLTTNSDRRSVRLWQWLLCSTCHGWTHSTRSPSEDHVHVSATVCRLLCVAVLRHIFQTQCKTHLSVWLPRRCLNWRLINVLTYLLALTASRLHTTWPARDVVIVRSR